MPLSSEHYDAVIIGGGFYGVSIAAYLAQSRGLKRVLLVEQEPTLLARASYSNQARVHNGYHYPRSFTTAYRSCSNAVKFCADWQDAIHKDFTKIYAIARRNSKVTAKQFVRFCDRIGAYIQPATEKERSLFAPRLIEDVFLVHEYAFNARQLADWAYHTLEKSGVELALGTRASSVTKQGHELVLALHHPEETEIKTRYLINCTYSGLNQLEGNFGSTATHLKHEITEMALMEMPDALRDKGITVMDGPFFSAMPFPARGLHSVSHVRYTPHMAWKDEKGVNPYTKLQEYPKQSRVDRMLRDVSRYLPSINGAQYRDSLFEIKTILVKNEKNDGRPILFEAHTALPGCYSILGSKIDNIYDALAKLDKEEFLPS